MFRRLSQPLTVPRAPRVARRGRLKAPLMTRPPGPCTWHPGPWPTPPATPPQSEGPLRASTPLQPPPSSPTLGHSHSQKPLPAIWGSEWALGRRPAPTLDAAGKLLPPAPAQECPRGGNDVQSGSPSRLQTNPPSPGTHPYQTGPEVVHILDHTGVCVCVCRYQLPFCPKS